MNLRSGIASPSVAGAAAIAALVAVAYWPSLSGDFLVDDYSYIILNPIIAASDGWLRIWTETRFDDYYALTHSTFWIDWRLWGRDASGYHAVNIGLHVVNALLLWRVASRFRLPWAFAAALLFALHPANVQAVAWISQRKTLLAGTFLLISLLAWLRYDEERDRHERYAALLLAFLLALLSKISAAVLPVLLPLVVWWRRGRVAWRDVWPIAPLFLLALLFGLQGVLFESVNPVSGSAGVSDPSLIERAASAGRALWFYLATALWPHPLVFFYPPFPAARPLAVALAAWLAFAGVVAIAWRFRASWGRPVFATLVWFAVAIAPTLGFLDFGHLRFAPVADPYLYLSLFAVCALAGGALHQAALRFGRPASIALGSVALVAFGLTRAQAGLYADRETLYLHTLAANPGSWPSHNNLGTLYYRRDQFDRAEHHYRAALAIDRDAETVANLGMILAARGAYREAIDAYTEAIALDRSHAGVRVGLGKVHLDFGDAPTAEQHFRDALARDPGNSEAHAFLTEILLASGREDEAFEHMARAIEHATLQQMDPRELAAARTELAGRYAQSGRIDPAIEHFREAARLAPGDASKHSNLGIALAQRGADGDRDAARAAFERAIATDATYAPARAHLRNLEARDEPTTDPAP